MRDQINNNNAILTKCTQYEMNQTEHMQPYSSVLKGRSNINFKQLPTDAGQGIQTTKNIVVITRAPERPEIITKKEFQKIINPN